MSRIILIPGTHGAINPSDDWWRPHSQNAQLLREAGHEVVSFEWSTKLDGLLGENDQWQNAGKRLVKMLKPRDNIIAHSHGGAVAAYAAEWRIPLGTVITLGTPPRYDVPYQFLADYSEHWVHVRGSKDWVWAILGAAGDGTFNWFRRSMYYADENVKWPCGHTELLDAKRWRDNGAMEWLK